MLFATCGRDGHRCRDLDGLQDFIIAVPVASRKKEIMGRRKHNVALGSLTPSLKRQSLSLSTVNCPFYLFLSFSLQEHEGKDQACRGRPQASKRGEGVRFSRQQWPAVEQHSSRDIEGTGGKEGRKDGLPSQAEQDRHCLDTHSFVPDLHVSACLQGLLCSEAGGGTKPCSPEVRRAFGLPRRQTWGSRPRASAHGGGLGRLERRCSLGSGSDIR